MPRRHVANENDHLNFLTPVIVVINYFIMTLVIVLFVKLTVIFLLFKALINTTKNDGRSLFITMPFIHQMAPFYFA